ncbi:MAG: nucleotidyltransferase domain-containing protein [Deltaproteobacteria bacterium]|nr:nucleotidyltransferase domain-containing protein [Deltaproteobacteria bacterium]
MQQAIVEELRAAYVCHTVILYGSRARGKQDAGSDYDVAGIRESGEPGVLHDARQFNGIFLDAFIYRESSLVTLTPDMIRLRAGVVLVEKGDFGKRLIARANELFKAGPEPLPATELNSLRTWIGKMLGRISRGGPEDVEANFRRTWLLHDLLELYFKLRGTWYLGPRESFAWLRANDPASYKAFENALVPEASRGAVRILADRVLGQGRFTSSRAAIDNS